MAVWEGLVLICLWRETRGDTTHHKHGEVTQVTEGHGFYTALPCSSRACWKLCKEPGLLLRAGCFLCWAQQSSTDPPPANPSSSLTWMWPPDLFSETGDPRFQDTGPLNAEHTLACTSLKCPLVSSWNPVSPRWLV